MTLRGKIILAGAILLTAVSVGSATPVEKWVNPEASLASEAIVDDFDLDGDLDIVGAVKINLATIDGEKGKVVELMGIPKAAPRVADLDDDGKMELILAIESMGMDNNTSKIAVYKMGWMGWNPIFEEPGSRSTITGAADIDGDGSIELVASPNGNTIKLFSTNPIASKWTISTYYPGAGSLGDINGDGIVDVIALAKEENYDGKFNETINFTTIKYDLDTIVLSGTDGSEILRIPKTQTFRRLAITADLNENGSDELILFLDDGLRVVNGEAETVINLNLEGGALFGAVGDFHPGEGLEIVVVGGDGVVHALNKNGQELWNYQTEGVSSNPVIADIEGKEKQSIIVGLNEGTIISLNGETGSRESSITTSGKPGALFVGDVNGDDKLDILTTIGVGLTLFETESEGTVEWPCSSGDAQGTQSYRLSRNYAERVAMPSEFKAFNWSIVFYGLGMLAIAGIAYLVFTRVRKTVREVTITTPASSAIAEIEAEYNRNRENPISIRKLAMEYAAQNVTALKATELYNKALKLDPNQPQIIRALANSYLIRNALNAESEEVFKKAVELAPNDQKLIAGMVSLLSLNKRVDPDALRIYERFYYLGLENPKATALIARELARQQNMEPFAIHVYGRHLKQEPTDADVLGALLEYNKSIQNMEEYLSIARSVMDDPKLSLGLKIKIGLDLLKSDYLDDAEKLISSAIEGSPTDVESWWAAKELYTKTGKTEEAGKAAARLVQIYTDLQRANPLQTDIKMALGKLYGELGDPVAGINQLKTIPPNDANYHDAALLLTQLYLDVGELDKATTFFETIPNGQTLHPAIFKKIEEMRTSKIFAAQTGGADRTAIIGDDSRTVVQGSSVTRYKILGELGRGGMGVVYKAEDTVLKREVAFKVLPEDLRNHPEIAKSFESEAQNLAKLSHPNIVTVFDAGQQAGTLFFVMQYIEGMDLREELKRSGGALPIKRVVEVAKQVLRALAYAHEKRIIHRDIKTSNVMVTKDGGVMLMDFGLSKILEGAASEKTKVSGTPFYMSPEQIQGVGVDHLTDIYSFGIMLYEMAAGRVPFTAGDVAYHHLHTQAEPPNKVNPQIPDSLVSVIMKCIEKEKSKRYQKATDIINDLDFVM